MRIATILASSAVSLLASPAAAELIPAAAVTTNPSNGAAASTFGPAPTSCDLLFCADGISYCEYWGGYSSFDMSLHKPVPGETRTAIGLCSTATAGAAASSTATNSVV